MRGFSAALVAFALGMGTAVGVSAEDGVSANRILLGQSVVLSGPQAENGANYTNGIKLYFEQANARGGVNGRRIELQTLDDAYDPKRAAANSLKLVEEDKVFALFGYAGTGSAMASLPVVDKYQVPFIAPLSGADVLRDGKHRMLFVMRAGYADEFERTVEHLVTTGVKQIAVAYQDDNFGRSALKAAQGALAKFKLEAVAVGAIDGKSYDPAQAVEAVAKARPGAILMGTAGKASMGFIRDYLKTGERPQFFGLSVMSAAQLREELGGDSAGIAVAQVVPSPWSRKYPIVKEYLQALGKERAAQAHHNGLEGFIAAKMLVRALERAGNDLTREKLVLALEGMNNVDLGGYFIEFSRQRHTASRFVDLSIISRDGQFIH